MNKSAVFAELTPEVPYEGTTVPQTPHFMRLRTLAGGAAIMAGSFLPTVSSSHEASAETVVAASANANPHTGEEAYDGNNVVPEGVHSLAQLKEIVAEDSTPAVLSGKQKAPNDELKIWELAGMTPQLIDSMHVGWVNSDQGFTSEGRLPSPDPKADHQVFFSFNGHRDEIRFRNLDVFGNNLNYPAFVADTEDGHEDAILIGCGNGEVQVMPKLPQKVETSVHKTAIDSRSGNEITPFPKGVFEFLEVCVDGTQMVRRKEVLESDTQNFGDCNVGSGVTFEELKPLKDKHLAPGEHFVSDSPRDVDFIASANPAKNVAYYVDKLVRPLRHRKPRPTPTTTTTVPPTTTTHPTTTTTSTTRPATTTTTTTHPTTTTSTVPKTTTTRPATTTTTVAETTTTTRPVLPTEKIYVEKRAEHANKQNFKEFPKDVFRFLVTCMDGTRKVREVRIAESAKQFMARCTLGSVVEMKELRPLDKDGRVWLEESRDKQSLVVSSDPKHDIFHYVDRLKRKPRKPVEVTTTTAAPATTTTTLPPTTTPPTTTPYTPPLTTTTVSNWKPGLTTTTTVEITSSTLPPTTTVPATTTTTQSTEKPPLPTPTTTPGEVTTTTNDPFNPGTAKQLNTVLHLADSPAASTYTIYTARN